MVIASAAAVTGGRPAKGAAVVAAPLVLTLVGVHLLQASAGILLTVNIAQFLALGIAFVVAGVISRNHGLFWWAAGLFAAVLPLVPIFSGLLTPTEAMAVIALFAIPAGLIINTAVRGTGVAQALVVATAEIGALTAVFCLSGIGGYALASSGFLPTLGALGGLAPPLQVLLICLLAVILGVLLTPLLAFVPVLTLLIGPALSGGLPIDVGTPAALLVLAGLTSMIIRSIRGRNEPPPVGASSITLSPPTWFAMIAVTVAIMALTAAALLYLSLAPPR